MDDQNMMEALLKQPASGNESGRKGVGSQYGSSTNLAGPASGGLPGLRGRTRQSVSGTSGTNGAPEKNFLNVSGTPNKAFTTDTEEDETVDFLLKSTMAIPKGQPPKKRTKKYGERKSCNLTCFDFLESVHIVINLGFFFIKVRRTRNLNDDEPEAM
jgi:hypothetical protein